MTKAARSASQLAVWAVRGYGGSVAGAARFSRVALRSEDRGRRAGRTDTPGHVYSAIIPATDDPGTLERCITAIRRSADPPDELIVVDGPAVDGPAAARNAGAARANGSILVFVDSDVVVHPDAFTRIRAAFAEKPSIAAVFGSYDNAPSPHGTVSTFRNLLHHYIHHQSPGRATTFWAGLGAVRRDSFVAVDGFDDWRFRAPSVEDIDFGLRLAAAGGHIELDPKIQGTHLKHWALGDMLRTDLLRRGAPWTALVLDRGAPAARLNLRGRHFVAAVAFTAGVGSAALRRPRLAAQLWACYLLLNTRFYRLLLASAGPRSAAAGVGLLAIHNVAALGSTPLGLMAFGIERASTRPFRWPAVPIDLEKIDHAGRRGRRSQLEGRYGLGPNGPPAFRVVSGGSASAEGLPTLT